MKGGNDALCRPAVNPLIQRVKDGCAKKIDRQEQPPAHVVCTRARSLSKLLEPIAVEEFIFRIGRSEAGKQLSRKKLTGKSNRRRTLCVRERGAFLNCLSR